MKIDIRHVAIAKIVTAMRGAVFSENSAAKAIAVSRTLRGIPLPPVVIDRRDTYDNSEWRVLRNGEYIEAIRDYFEGKFSVDSRYVSELPRQLHRYLEEEHETITVAFVTEGSDDEVEEYLRLWDSSPPRILP